MRPHPDDRAPGVTCVSWTISPYRMNRRTLFLLSMASGAMTHSALAAHLGTMLVSGAFLAAVAAIHLGLRHVQQSDHTWTTTVTPDGLLTSRFGGPKGLVQQVVLNQIGRVEIAQVDLPILQARTAAGRAATFPVMAVALLPADGTAPAYVPLRLLDTPTGLLPAIRTHTVGRQSFLDQDMHPLARRLLT